MRGNLALQRERPPEFDRTRDQASALQRAWSITRRTRLMRSHRVPEAGVAIGHFAFSLNCASGARGLAMLSGRRATKGATAALPRAPLA